MDSSLTQPNASVVEQEDEWDTNGFVIPSFSVGDFNLSSLDAPEATDVKPPPKVIKEEVKIYLGPHGAPPSQAKQKQLNFNAAGRKQCFKQKLKEAERRYSSTVGRESKAEHIRELVGRKTSNPTTIVMSKSKTST